MKKLMLIMISIATCASAMEDTKQVTWQDLRGSTGKHVKFALEKEESASAIAMGKVDLPRLRKLIEENARNYGIKRSFPYSSNTGIGWEKGYVACAFARLKAGLAGIPHKNLGHLGVDYAIEPYARKAHWQETPEAQQLDEQIEEDWQEICAVHLSIALAAQKDDSQSS